MVNQATFKDSRSTRIPKDERLKLIPAYAKTHPTYEDDMVEVSEGGITGSVEAQAQWGSALRRRSASNRLVNCLGNDPLVEGRG